MAGDKPGKWPGPVTMNDDDPKPGNCYIILKIPSLKKPFFGKGNFTMHNKFETEHVTVIVDVQEDSGTVVRYEYSKNMPEDINSKKSGAKAEDGKVTLTLNKVHAGSWAAHAHYLISPPD